MYSALSSGLQHDCSLAYDCTRFRITQYYFMRFRVSFLNLGWCYLSKISHFVLPSDLVHPRTTLPSQEGFSETETRVIRPRPSLCLHSSKSDSCRDDATKSKLWLRRTLKERLPKSNLASRSVKKFNLIIPSAEVGNLQTKNEWLEVTLPVWNKTCCSPTISRLFPVILKVSKVVLSSGTSATPGCKTIAGSQIYNEDLFCTLNFYCHCRGAMICVHGD